MNNGTTVKNNDIKSFNHTHVGGPLVSFIPKRCNNKKPEMIINRLKITRIVCCSFFVGV